MEEKLPENQSYFVLDAITQKREDILSLTGMMTSDRRSVDKYLGADMVKARDHYFMLQKAYEMLVGDLGETRLSLMEIGENDLAAYAGALAAQLAGFNLMTPDYSALAAVLRAFAEKLPVKETVNASVIARCMNAVRMGFYPTDLHNIELILRGIAFPKDAVTNLLDPCCGEGAALKKLAVGNNCFTYGVELDEGRANKAQETLHRVGFGSFFHSRINHDAFHAVLLNPPYLSVLTEGGNRARDEKRFLIDAIPYLTAGGLMIYIIPYYRLTPDICRILCDNFENVSVHRFTDAVFKRFNQIVVMGTKIRRIDGSEQADAMAELAYRKDGIPCISEIAEGRYALPAQPKPVALFKGAVFNKQELARQLKQSKSLESLLTAKSLAQTMRRPPLPFTFAQLGLVGGSGLINGLIDCDYPHIIKGRIVKEVITEATENRSRKGELMSAEIKEKVINRMIFNLLTPEGFKALA
ncbi:MAG: class I SAM-dependent methyltransferase [Oscillospiraceae bacterium]|jgi:hypothetical protein|nr:class I SAM-dependent methyltransferase [Oscillospiraceae bacterium]